MASGDPVVQILQVMPLAATFATPKVLTGGSTPAEKVLVWAFDDSTDEYLDWLCRLHGYGGGGLTFRVAWSTVVTTGNFGCNLSIRRMEDDAEDLDSSFNYTTNDVETIDAAPSAVNEITRLSVALTSGAQMDSAADADFFIVRMRRNTSVASDIVGDVYVWGITGEET